MHFNTCTITFLFLQDMSRTMCENIFTQAAFTPSVWELALRVIDMYENSQLKNQKLSKKCMIAKPAQLSMFA